MTITGNTDLLATGQQTQLFATATLSNGTQEDQTDGAAWSSNNPNIASVNSTGLVTAIANGVTSINATYQGVTAIAMVRITGPIAETRVPVTRRGK